MVTKKVQSSSLADALWEEIKDLSIDMFSLPNQKVQDHVTRKDGTSDSVILGLKSPAVLPSLEATLGVHKQYRKKVSYTMKAEGENITESFPKYEMVDTDGGYVVVKRYVPPLDKPELQDKPEYFISGR